MSIVINVFSHEVLLVSIRYSVQICWFNSSFTFRSLPFHLLPFTIIRTYMHTNRMPAYITSPFDSLSFSSRISLKSLFTCSNVNRDPPTLCSQQRLSSHPDTQLPCMHTLYNLTENAYILFFNFICLSASFATPKP